ALHEILQQLDDIVELLVGIDEPGLERTRALALDLLPVYEYLVMRLGEVLDEVLELPADAYEVDRGPADHGRGLVVRLLERAAQVLHRVLVAIGLRQGRPHAGAELPFVG